MSKVFIGIDNGVTGSIGIIASNEQATQTWFFSTPIFKQQNYTKKKDNISRIDTKSLKLTLETLNKNENELHILLERPMVNPMRFKASTSALRALEATLCVVESLGVSYSYLDSKEWQKVLLPQGIVGSDLLKKASYDIGLRMFPQHSDAIKAHKDADGILIAEYCRRKFS